MDINGMGEEFLRMNNTQDTEDEINLVDIAKVLWKRKIMIVMLTVLFSIGAAGIASVRYPETYVSGLVISLNFPGIEKHKYPDGTIFEGRNIIAPNTTRNQPIDFFIFS